MHFQKKNLYPIARRDPPAKFDNFGIFMKSKVGLLFQNPTRLGLFWVFRVG